MFNFFKKKPKTTPRIDLSITDKGLVISVLRDGKVEMQSTMSDRKSIRDFAYQLLAAFSKKKDKK